MNIIEMIPSILVESGNMPDEKYFFKYNFHRLAT